MTLVITHFDSGFLHLTWNFDGTPIHTEASFISDGISDMAKAAVHLVKGFKTTRFAFQDEPGEYVFLLERIHLDIVRLTLYKNQKCCSRRNETHLISFDCAVLDFGGQVFSTLHSLMILEDPPYKERWKHEFPMEEYRVLKEKL